MFLSCSADWTIKLWDDRRTSSVLSWDLSNAVVDVAWAPFSSTVFACVTANATVHVFDVAQNKLEPMCEQKVVRKSKLTRVCFNAKEPIVLVGDDKGSVLALKLSPNLRKLTVVPSHQDKKTGEPLPPPTDKDELQKWQQEVCWQAELIIASCIRSVCTFCRADSAGLMETAGAGCGGGKTPIYCGQSDCQPGSLAGYLAATGGCWRDQRIERGNRVTKG